MNLVSMEQCLLNFNPRKILQERGRPRHAHEVIVQEGLKDGNTEAFSPEKKVHEIQGTHIMMEDQDVMDESTCN